MIKWIRLEQSCQHCLPRPLVYTQYSSTALAGVVILHLTKPHSLIFSFFLSLKLFILFYFLWYSLCLTTREFFLSFFSPSLLLNLLLCFFNKGCGGDSFSFLQLSLCYISLPPYCVFYSLFPVSFIHFSVPLSLFLSVSPFLFTFNSLSCSFYISSDAHISFPFLLPVHCLLTLL